MLHTIPKTIVSNTYKMYRLGKFSAVAYSCHSDASTAFLITVSSVPGKYD